MVKTITQISAMILTLEASYFLLKANLGLSPEIIAKLSAPCYGYNKEVLKTLVGQVTDTRVGFILLLISFVLQMINVLWPMRYEDFGIDWLGVIISVIVCTVTFATACCCSRSLSKKLCQLSKIKADQQSTRG